MLVIFKKFFIVLLLGLTFFLTGCAKERYHRGHPFAMPMPMVCVKPSSWVVSSESKGAWIRLISGSDIEACSAGQVIFLDSDFRGYGKTVIIQNAENFSMVYARLGEILVREGEFVKSGQRIARARQHNDGKLGFYFELRKKSVAINPVEYLQ